MTTYEQAGVNIAKANAFVEKIKGLNPSIGGFAGLYPFGDGYLAASTDGVGTKLKLALERRQLEGLGIDLVAMCVNDILVCGAKPLFFLDYYATGALEIETAFTIVQSIQRGCEEAHIPLLGGETAEMPGLYRDKDFDLAGFAVGYVSKDDLLDPTTVRPGDLIAGLPSSGIHSNGYSLVRKILETRRLPAHLEEGLLAPTRIYVDAAAKIRPKTLCHITGGGLLENLPRSLPKGLGADLQQSSWEVPEIFYWLQEAGNVRLEEMYRTFNMGIGFCAVVDTLPEGWIALGTVTENQGVRIR